MSLLRLDGVAVARGGLRVLEGVTLTLDPGQALALRGPNGIGKTTLLRMLAGLQPPLEGRVELAPDSVALAGHAEGVKAALSVAENLAFWAAVFGAGRAARAGRVAAALAAMNLDALAARPARALSAGQRRRLGLARLAVTGRALWLLDEPTVSLDRESVGLFAGMLRAHLAAGGGALIATHVDLGLPEAGVLDLAAFRAARGGGGARGARPPAGFDEVFA